jgi:hypothetical protein
METSAGRRTTQPLRHGRRERRLVKPPMTGGLTPVDDSIVQSVTSVNKSGPAVFRRAARGSVCRRHSRRGRLGIANGEGLPVSNSSTGAPRSILVSVLLTGLQPPDLARSGSTNSLPSRTPSSRRPVRRRHLPLAVVPLAGSSRRLRWCHCLST